MSFMDEVSAFTKGVGQKAKGNYDIVNMNSKVSSLTKEIKTLYAQIGEIYYNTHKDDSEEVFYEMIEKIKDLEIQIADVKQQIEEKKKETAAVSLTTDEQAGDGSHGFCKNCGAALIEDSNFCIKCGTKI